jgi:succinate-semialdehyde dehydrogenase/glutarate-semialdehyde dehydrogenase
VAALEIRNPATGELAGRVECASPIEIADSVLRARRAQQGWRERSFSDRAAIVRRFHDLILDRDIQVLDTIQSETGKTRRDALSELITVAGTARYYLKHGARHLEAKRRRGAVPAITSAEVVYKPHGVVGLITPWNYPFLLGIADALPALLAGNAVVIKPSELTPLSAVLARDLFVESGLDPDLAIVVHGAGSAGACLIEHVDYVGFTGGVETGRKVAIAASGRLIPYSLELGGKNPMIVLEGASVEQAATGLIAGAFSNSGQTCISIERVYVQQDIFEEFSRRVAQKTEDLKIGFSRSWDLDVGSMISPGHVEKILRHIGQAVDGGAKVLAGGKPRIDLGAAFVQPTVLTGVTDAMPISREETFGPVVALYPVRDAEEAIERANDSVYGLNASVWAGEGNRAREVARRLETGSAAINATLLIYHTFDAPMGGVKQSGIGRRHGAHGILRYTQAQSIVSSIAAGGGYDALALRIRDEKAARSVIRATKLWRKIPWM